MQKIKTPKTIKELLNTWDSGGFIWSIRCCNGSPSEEQSAQLAMIEFVRRNHLTPCQPKEWDALCDSALKPIEKKLIGLEKHHIDWAKWWSYQLCLPDGIQHALDKIIEHKGESILMPVCNRFPFLLRLERN